jgi:glycosyltransferase involved in cell wall biosynthesis
MYNKNLVQALYQDENVNILSLSNKNNESYFESINIPFYAVKPPNSFLYRLSRTTFLRKVYRYLIDWNISSKFAQFLKTHDTSVIEFMDIHSEAYSYLKQNPKTSRKTKVVIRSHTPWGLLKNTYLPEEVEFNDTWNAFEKEKFCFEKCDAITTPSEDLKCEIIELYHIHPDKIIVIPNLVDSNHFKPYEDEINNKIGFKILHVGRFERPKGVETLTKAFIKIAKKYHDVTLINVGKLRGSSASICESWLEKENLLDRVSFLDFIDYEQLPQYYHESDLVIVPSEIYESFSYTVAQGMSCGKIVIASKIGGIPETVDSGKAGFLFTPGNVEELEKKIESIYLEKVNVTEIEVHARNHVLENFSIHALKEKYIQFYQSLLN